MGTSLLMRLLLKPQILIILLRSPVNSVPNVIFLQAPEFSGWLIRPKNYENGRKNIFGLSVVLESQVKKAKFWLSKSFFNVENWPNSSQLFFALKNIQKGEQFLSLSYFDNFDFKCSCITKRVPNFLPSILKWPRGFSFGS